MEVHEQRICKGKSSGLSCTFCAKIFSRKQTLTKHQANCKAKPSDQIQGTSTSNNKASAGCTLQSAHIQSTPQVFLLRPIEVNNEAPKKRPGNLDSEHYQVTQQFIERGNLTAELNVQENNNSPTNSLKKQKRRSTEPILILPKRQGVDVDVPSNIDEQIPKNPVNMVRLSFVSFV